MTRNPPDHFQWIRTSLCVIVVHVASTPFEWWARDTEEGGGKGKGKVVAHLHTNSKGSEWRFQGRRMAILAAINRENLQVGGTIAQSPCPEETPSAAAEATSASVWNRRAASWKRLALPPPPPSPSHRRMAKHLLTPFPSQHLGDSWRFLEILGESGRGAMIMAVMIVITVGSGGAPRAIGGFQLAPPVQSVLQASQASPASPASPASLDESIGSETPSAER